MKSRTKFIIAFMLLVGILFFMTLNYVSAQEFSKTYDSKVKEVSFNDKSKEVLKVKLLFNTDKCANECQAIIRIESKEKLDNILNGFNFKKKDISWYETSLVNRIEVLEEVVTNLGNKTFTSYKWTPIIKDSLNSKMNKQGVYTIRLIGYKNPSDTIDWIPTILNIPISEWMIWGTSQVYDEINDSVVNTTLWSSYEDSDIPNDRTSTVSEDTDYIEVNSDLDSGGSAVSNCSTSVTSIKLPSRNEIYNLTTRVNLRYVCSGGSSISNSTFKVFGVIVDSYGWNNGFCPYAGYAEESDAVYLIVKNATSNQFIIYKDGTKIKDITPTDNNLTINASIIRYDTSSNAAAIGRISYVYYQSAMGSSVTAISPSNNYVTLSSNTTFSASAYSIGGFNLTNITFNIYYPTGILFNSSNIVLTSNEVTKSITLLSIPPNDLYYWNVTTCATNGTFTECSGTSTYYFNKSAYRFNSQTYNSETFSGSSETFTLNLTADTSFTGIYGNVVYNGIYHNATVLTYGLDKVLTSTFSVPLVNTTSNYSFYWNVALVNSSGTNLINYTLTNQSITAGTSLIVDSNCSAGYTPILNFTSLWEQNQTNINLTVFYYLTYGLSSNNTYSMNNTLTNVGSFAICINSTQAYYNIGTAEFDYYVGGAVNRRYYVFSNSRLVNQTVNIPLYSLESTDSTSFLFTAQSTDLIPYTNHYVSLLRWYPSENSYKVVEIQKTDDKGQTILHVKTEDVDYRIGLYQLDGTLVKMFNPIKFICQTNPCTYSLLVDNNPLNLMKFTNIQSNLSYNPTTKVFSYIWSDPSQESQIMNLTVYKVTGTGDHMICNSFASGYTGALQCDVSSNSGLFRADVYRITDESMFMAQDLEESRQTMVDVDGGAFGLFIGAMFFIFFAMLGVISPVLVIIFAILGLIPSLLLGSITWSIYCGIIVIGGVVLHFMRRI